MPADLKNPALTALRTATADLHRQVEAASSIDLECPDLSAYARHLSILQTWIHDVELDAVYTTANVALKPLPWVHWIQQDLAHLRQQGHICHRPVQLKPPTTRVASTPSAALGHVYVLEGARLGGHVMLKAFGRQFPGEPFHFLVGDGQAPALRWRTLCANLEHRRLSPSDIELASAAAQQAFADLLSTMDAFNAVTPADI